MMESKSIYDRLAGTLANSFEGLDPVWTRNGLCKKWAASVVGCQVGQLISDPELRRMLKNWEASNRTGRSIGRSGQVPGPTMMEKGRVLALQAALKKERDDYIQKYIEQFRSLGLPEVDQ
ncbi:hypothetical protein ACC703_12880 [Rhizobium ruizarguesonis]